MTITKTDLKVLDAEVTCVIGSVESGVGYMYFGTNSGDVKKYNIQTGVITVLKNIGEKVASMTLYSGTLWIGTASGKLISLTTS